MSAPSPERLRAIRAEWRERVGYAGPRPWADNEQAIAIDMKARGKSCGQIAMRLVGRTPDAVHSRLRYIRARFAEEGSMVIDRGRG